MDSMRSLLSLWLNPRVSRLAPRGGLLSLAAALALTGPVRADVRFENCQPTPDGGVTCDTVPEGDTLLDDEAARFGLFDEASPGWSEYSPYGWDDDI